MRLLARRLPTERRGIQQTLNHLDDGRVVVHNQHDVSGILRANHFQRSEQTMRHGSEIMNHVARLDPLSVQRWMATRGIVKGWYQIFMNDKKLLRDYLNDPDNKIWRTRLGQI